MWCKDTGFGPGGLGYEVNGVVKYVTAGKSIFFPCKDVMREANGVHQNGLVFLAFKAIDEGKAVLSAAKGVYITWTTL